MDQNIKTNVIKNVVKLGSKAGGNRLIMSGISHMIPNLAREDATKILNYKNQETKIFAEILTGFINEIKIDDNKKDLPENIKEMLEGAGDNMSELPPQLESIYKNPKHEEAKMVKALIEELQDHFPAQYRSIIVNNGKLLAVGVETNPQLRNIFNDICMALSSRNYEKIREWLLSMDKNNRLFALKMTLYVGREVETNQAFREKFVEIMDRFDKFYNREQIDK